MMLIVEPNNQHNPYNYVAWVKYVMGGSRNDDDEEDGFGGLGVGEGILRVYEESVGLQRRGSGYTNKHTMKQLAYSIMI